MKFKLRNLKYEQDALAPFLSLETLEFHYGRHHRAYVEKLNKLIDGTPFENMSMEEIIMKSDGAIFNNAAQAWNHSFYWQCLTPNSKKLDAKSPLGVALKKRFLESDLEATFTQSATTLFGSGWTWLVLDKNNNLSVINTSNADTPIRHGLRPLLVCDVWEHAYYIDYRNSRQKYLQVFWQYIDWEFVSRMFDLQTGTIGARRVPIAI